MKSDAFVPCDLSWLLIDDNPGRVNTGHLGDLLLVSHCSLWVDGVGGSSWYHMSLLLPAPQNCWQPLKVLVSCLCFELSPPSQSDLDFLHFLLRYRCVTMANRIDNNMHSMAKIIIIKVSSISIFWRKTALTLGSITRNVSLGLISVSVGN